MRIFALLLGACALVSAQDESGVSRTGAVVGNIISVGATLEAITGAPYSAGETVSRVRILPDGTRIEQPPTSMLRLYRDGLGRVREETFLIASSGALTLGTLMISDPTTGLHYTLDTKKKIAHRVKVNVMRPGERKPPMGPSGPNTTREPLGTQFINGIEARGELVRLTFPAGTLGNDRPIVQTTEIWTSPELQVTIRQIVRSPMAGDSTLEMTNISRVEPDPLLFTVPIDYEIVDDKGPYVLGR